MAVIATPASKKPLEEQERDISDWLSAAEARISSIEKSFDQQLAAISTTNVIPTEQLSQQLEVRYKTITPPFLCSQLM